ncbi:fanconi anemia group D2 protein [Gossypium australe]|uniref:Fanconi anemia group D2 protein n=1 Tax=Gossypium australe TaxID=47621 RepID=A0A5B6UL19_9ROSI|nr:fanconi anemia group D2 protein [Gossypium australe]
MMRSRLLWFTLGFSVTAASISQFIYRDLWTDRYALKSDVLTSVVFFGFWNLESFLMKEKFDTLEARVSNLESLPTENPNPALVLIFFFSIKNF